MEMQVSLPVDKDGFLRRECPHCERQFKWFHGSTDERPVDFLEPENYVCPYCGEPAGHGSWWTLEQLTYMHEAAKGPIMEEAAQKLRQALGGVGSRGNSFVRVEVKEPKQPEPPMPLVEPDDMMMVEPPCHSFEPLKVADDWTESIHCLMCGEQFTV